MAEQINLTTAETKPANTLYGLERLTIDVAGKLIVVQLRGQNGEGKSFVYGPTPSPGGATGASLLTTLNRANFTSVSLVRRIYQQLVADGYLAGTVAGTPD